MSYKDYELNNAQLNGVNNCPHCGQAHPTLYHKWHSDSTLPRADDGPPSCWSVFACTACGSLISAKGDPFMDYHEARIIKIYPDNWDPDDNIPQTASRYLKQAKQTLGNPDASVVMSNSSIDAMLKDHELKNGSLYDRINKAVEKGILTSGMAEWAHRVRIDSNNPRHADEDDPHMSPDDAQRAFEFAKAIAEILYVLPSKMPTEEVEDEGS